MKKNLIVAALILSSSAFAGDFVSVSVDHLTDRKTNADSTVQYVRAGKEINGIQAGLQSRNARSNDGTGIKSSLEFYLGKNYTVSSTSVTPYIGTGYDNGKNGASDAQYTYGVVGVTATKKLSAGSVGLGYKTRVNWDHSKPAQTITSISYSYPVAKQVSLTAGVSRSAQDIKERATSVGIGFTF